MLSPTTIGVIETALEESWAMRGDMTEAEYATWQVECELALAELAACNAAQQQLLEKIEQLEGTE